MTFVITRVKLCLTHRVLQRSSTSDSALVGRLRSDEATWSARMQICSWRHL